MFVNFNEFKSTIIFSKIFKTDYFIEKDPIINKFIAKDCVDFNLAYFNLGIIDIILNESNFVSYY